jgi:hypothetical protein
MVAGLLAATGADAATVVLKGGRQLDVASVRRQGNNFVVTHANGRVEAYPAAAVDLEATRIANEVPAPPPSPAPALGPHSPFFGAQASPGKPVIVVTDDDVQHVVPPDEDEAAWTVKPQSQAPAEGQVTLIDYGKQRLEDGSWEISATVINSGRSPVAGISADVRLMDAEGKVIGSGTGTMEGTLAPTQQGAVTARVSSPVEPVQIGFSFRWQSITPAPEAEAGGGDASKAEAKPAPAQPVPAAAAPPAGYTVPPGSSPNTLPTNAMAVPGNLLEPPVALQVPRPQPEKPKA